MSELSAVKIQRMVKQIEEEIAIHKSGIDKQEKELLMVEKSIAYVKMLQEKANHVIKCNELKFRNSQEQVEVMKNNFSKLVEKKNVEESETDQLLCKVGELKNFKDLLEKELRIKKCEKKEN